MYTALMTIATAAVACILAFYAGVLTGAARASDEIKRQQRRVRTMLDAMEQPPSVIRSAPVRETSSPTHPQSSDRSNHPNWWNL